MNMNIKQLINKSKFDTDKIDRRIRFVSNGEYFQDLDINQWNSFKKDL